MKKLLLLLTSLILVMLSLAGCSKEQQIDRLVNKQFPALTAEHLKEEKLLTILIYKPTCKRCQRTVPDLVENLKDKPIYSLSLGTTKGKKLLKIIRDQFDVDPLDNQQLPIVITIIKKEGKFMPLGYVSIDKADMTFTSSLNKLKQEIKS